MSENVIFIRHKFNNKDEIGLCEKLYKEKKIAYNNDGMPWSSTGRDYIGYKIFDKLQKGSVKYFIVAEYSITNEKGKVIRKEYLYGKTTGKSVQNKNWEKNKKTYKTLEIEAKDFPINDFPVYLAIRPPFVTFREYGKTACKSYFFEKIIPSVYRNNKIKLTNVHILHASMIEQMCEEYLRQCGYDNKKLKYSSCRVGKDMEKYDIVGYTTDGIRVLAQVKSDWKSEYEDIFKNDKSSGIKFLFASNEDEDGKKQLRKSNGAEFIAIQDVFNYFMETTEGKIMLKNMAGIPDKYYEDCK